MLQLLMIALAVAEVTELLGEARARVDELHAQGTSKAQARSAAAKGFWVRTPVNNFE